MKLTIKTLQNSTFKVDIDPDKTVKELKETIEKEQGKEYTNTGQKLIYNGKILVDENKLAEYEFDEKKFVVLMMTRPAPVPKPALTTEQTSSTTKQSDEVKPTTAPATRPQTTSSSTTPSDPTSATPVITASGTATQQPVSTARSTNPSEATNDTHARLASFITHSQFRHMQELIQQSPHLLSSTIESLAVTDPEMYNFISENPDAFVNALNHPPMADGRSGQQSTVSAQRTSSQGRSGGAQQSGNAPPVVDQLLVNVSERDKEAIERLKELGFSEIQAVQAYMACDKDEQLAANLLFQMD